MCCFGKRNAAHLCINQKHMTLCIVIAHNALATENEKKKRKACTRHSFQPAIIILVFFLSSILLDSRRFVFSMLLSNKKFKTKSYKLTKKNCSITRNVLVFFINPFTRCAVALHHCGGTRAKRE